jgi:hypothetical protein
MEEYKNRYNFLNWLFRDNILIQWSPFKSSKIYNNIAKETNGELDDGHYSEIGHMELSNDFIRLIENPNLRTQNNNIFNNLI